MFVTLPQNAQDFTVHHPDSDKQKYPIKIIKKERKQKDSFSHPHHEAHTCHACTDCLPHIYKRGRPCSTRRWWALAGTSGGSTGTCAGSARRLSLKSRMPISYIVNISHTHIQTQPNLTLLI